MLLSTVFAAALVGAGPTSKPFEFKDGDRVVWLGSTLVEREQRYGYWETALVAANADKNITLRNLGWSGDTVRGEARASFDFNKPDAGFTLLVKQALKLKPTVIFISYGTNEAFEGKEGLPKFEKGLEKLLDALKPANARVVLFSPVGFEELPRFPFAKERNEALRPYREVVHSIAQKRGCCYAPLGELIALEALRARDVKPPYQLTDNGMHLTEAGYLGTVDAFRASLGLYPRRDEELGTLRKAIIAKNELFFHRWRPQNETYLFGFRKHEQGNNAKEVEVEFDPLVEKADEEVAKIRKGLK
ncbi:MAG: SGNH/GDSL hydrolase family protein [Planctomycetes bacterium]|nr:SGNH/GDSL hydrolase family protein [Planctomycetota bacterium]